MKTRFIVQGLMAFALCTILASGASATELKVRGSFDVYGMWSANLVDHYSKAPDADNYFTTQRMRTYFDYVANENLKGVLGLEIDNVWGDNWDNVGGDWGTDGKGNIEVKHAYLDFTFPDSAVSVQTGLQYVALPGVFGNPVFDDDAAAVIVSGKVNDSVSIAAGYSRGVDGSYNTASFTSNSPLYGMSNDDIDMAFIAAPIDMKGQGFTLAPYFAYAWIGANAFGLTDDAKAWVVGANAALTLFSPLSIAADLIYGDLTSGDYETKGWYTALAATYAFDALTATVFTTYATGADKDADKDSFLPTLAEGWGVSPYIGGVRAFSTTYDSFATDTLEVGSDGTGLWTMGLVLDNISFVDKLSHKLVLAYGRGTSDDESGLLFTKKDSAWEVYAVNSYAIYENLAAINELGYFQGSSDLFKDMTDDELDASYFTTVGFSYKF